jgi:glutamine amidotransferase
MKITIVNSGVGNVRSVANMLRRLNVEAEISNDAGVIARSDAVILPGVGSFDAAIRTFRSSGIVDVLNERVAEGKTPMLGICLGMQLMGSRSEEGNESGFGWIPGHLKRFQPSDGAEIQIRVPHMGWNIVQPASGDILYTGLEREPRFYFDHSYYFVVDDPAHCAATTRHGVQFAAGIRQGPLFGVQFHPEKSHRFGMKLLSNFVTYATSAAAKREVDVA